MSKQPLYEVEGRPVFYRDVLHCPPRLFNRAGSSVRAYLADNGAGEATMRNLINAGHIAPGGLTILHKGMTYAATAI